MIDKTLLDILVCPVSQTPLIFIEASNELASKASGLAYPIRDGIPVLLKEAARSLSDNELKQLH